MIHISGTELTTMIDILTCVVNQSHQISINVQGNSHFPPLTLVILGVGLFAYGFILYRRYRRLQDTPRTTARAVAMGFVHVRGKTIANQTLESPIAKVPCSYYSCRIEKWAPRQKSKWSTIFRDTRSCPFYIDDGTGRVLVNPAGAQFELPSTFAAITGAKQTDAIQLHPTPEVYIDTSLGVVPPSEADLLRLKTAGVENQGVLSLKHLDEARKEEILKKGYPDDACYRFTETCLPVGREVAVFGTCTDNPNSPDVSTIVKGQKEKILFITSSQEAKAESNLRSTAVKFVIAGAIVLFLSFASCQPRMRSVSGSAAHSSK